MKISQICESLETVKSKINMPTISEFFGIVILMFYGDHAPPHFHARYGEDEALIRISPVGVLTGHLPPRALSLVIDTPKTIDGGLELCCKP